MSIGLKGENLIFLISQPRAGSTLLQTILGNHSEIHTTSEPWLMLHSLYALKADGYSAEYDSGLARIARKHFLKSLPLGEETYLDSIRQMHTHLYSCALKDFGGRYFLDKTPRYYQILPELARTFPKAKYLIIFRNPLAVLCSIITTWVEELYLLYHYRYDLLYAPNLLLQGADLLKNNCLVLHYEQILENPQAEINKICQYLEIDFSPEMVNYNFNKLPEKGLGYQDQRSIYQKGKPNAQNIDKWILKLENPQLWRFADDYLQFLGAETINALGYSYTELRQTLDKHSPRYFYRWNTSSLLWRLGQPWEHYIFRFHKFIQERGLRKTLFYFIKKFLPLVK